MHDSVLVWFRRDLRGHDHAALGAALRRARRVHCAFVFDRAILDVLPTSTDRRVDFIHASLNELDQALRVRGGALIVRHGVAGDEIARLAEELGVTAVFANRDYEPQAKARDSTVAEALSQRGIAFELFKDQVIFDGPEVLTLTGRPYTVFTPYKKAWLKRLTDDDYAAHDGGGGQLVATPLAAGIPALATIGFTGTDLRQSGVVAGMSGARALVDDFRQRLANYARLRDYPAQRGVSQLSVHLRFGTISIREVVALALAGGALSGAEHRAGAATWLSELIWRDFYAMILDHFPHAAERSFKPEYDAIAWQQGAPAAALFAAWCEARTGYPLIDAALRQLARTGYMHNRLRMVVASFLCKDLGVDWRLGEAWFARQLNDFDLASNNGGWQWAASSGCDAQPYFRIFNPLTQSQRFDPGGRFIRAYLPELTAVPDQFIHAPWLMSKAQQSACGVVIGRDTPPPLVDHGAARVLTLQRYAVVKRRALP
jgi:deoxyribodipyrimidine photo-lyase